MYLGRVPKVELQPNTTCQGPWAERLWAKCGLELENARTRPTAAPQIAADRQQSATDELRLLGEAAQARSEVTFASFQNDDVR
jgi:hypothetical protein